MGSALKSTVASEEIRAAEALVALMGRVGVALSQAFEDVVGPELTGNGPLVTLMVLDIEGPKRPRQLQRATGLTSGGVSKLLLRLEEAELVNREFGQVPGDRRGATVSLTPKGEAAARQVAGLLLERLGEVRELIRELHGLVGDAQPAGTPDPSPALSST